MAALVREGRALQPFRQLLFECLAERLLLNRGSDGRCREGHIRLVRCSGGWRLQELLWQQGHMRSLAVQLAMCLVRLELLVAEVLGHRHDRRRLILKLAAQTLLLPQYPGLPLVVFHSAFRE